MLPIAFTMLKFSLASLAVLHPTPGQQEALGRRGPFRLRRAWPRSGRNVSLEYTDARGQLIPGQWFADADQLREVANETRLASRPATARVITIPGDGLLLQVGGADRRLTALAGLLADPTAQLISHRPERRAVLRLLNGQGVSYVKVVRRDDIGRLAAANEALSALASLTNAFVVPQVQEVVEASGLIVVRAVSGTSYFQMLQETEEGASLLRVTEQIGRALRALHQAELAPAARPHGPAEEIGVINKWLGHLQCHMPQVHARLQPYARSILWALEAEYSGPALLHRDFYDKQVIVGKARPITLLDLDTLAVGEPALDLANALGHLELREIQGRLSGERLARAAEALLRGYQPHTSVHRRLPVYTDATRLRLACVYSFRPGQHEVASRLASRIGRPPPGQ
ncbi:MAG: phosphotransferase [Anaerolineae bacterium]|nr:phosphotransferase [Anaerolineae bacterium]